MNEQILRVLGAIASAYKATKPHKTLESLEKATQLGTQEVEQIVSELLLMKCVEPQNGGFAPTVRALEEFLLSPCAGFCVVRDDGYFLYNWNAKRVFWTYYPTDKYCFKRFDDAVQIAQSIESRSKHKCRVAAIAKMEVL